MLRRYRRGVPLYYDRTNLQVGHGLDKALEQELIRARALVVLVTSATLKSFWVIALVGYSILTATMPESVPMKRALPTIVGVAKREVAPTASEVRTAPLSLSSA
jgi:hypothetical protein